MKPTLCRTNNLVRVCGAAGVLGLLTLTPPVGAQVTLPNEKSAMVADHAATIERVPILEELPAQTLTGIDLRREQNAITVVISGDGKLSHEAKLIDEHRLVVDIPQVASALQKPQMRVHHPLLTRVRLGYHPDKVRIVMDLASPATFSIESQGTQLLVKLTEGTTGHAVSLNAVAVEAVLPADRATEPQGEQEPGQILRITKRQRAVPAMQRTTVKFQVRPVQMTGEGETGEKTLPKEDVVLGETRYAGRRISLDFQQADISNVLRLIAEVSGFNIVVGEGVKSKVTMKLVSVPWDQALDMILRTSGLGKIKQGNILWIDSLANIAKQQDEEARAKDAKTKAEELVDRVFYIRNLQAQELMTSLRQYLSPRGVMQMSQGSNALIVRDTESKMGVIKQLIDGLDLQVPQVQIEARIVEADTVYSRGLGVQWGIENTNLHTGSFNAVGNITGPFIPGSGISPTVIPTDFLVNLPAQVAGLPAVPSIGYTFGKLPFGFALDLRLSAGELLGLSKVIASPKIITLDKREAKIAQGESIPFQTTSLQGTQTTFVDANLELNVTPQITSRDPKENGKLIMMRVRATRNAVGARSNPAGPSIDRREATTQVNIRDGETMVIGGVFIDTQANNVQGVPYLSRIPVLGWLFKNKSESVSKQELLIFLTPTIVQT
jgi:type IV pilus assembly protein PilQ